MKPANDYKNIKLPVFFLDETGILQKVDDPYFALGVIKTEKPHEIARAIRSARDKAHYYEEIKWNKMSPSKYNISKEIIKAFMDDESATFSCMIMKKSELDFNTYFQNDLYKVYRSFSTILIKKNIDQKTQEVCTVIADDYFYPEGVNLELATRAIINDHYKKLVVSGFLQMNSKASDLLQLTDLLLGGVMYDLKLNEGFIKMYQNFKLKLLYFLHTELGVNKSFFVNKNGVKQDKFLMDKFKVSIFKPSKSHKEEEEITLQQETNL